MSRLADKGILFSVPANRPFKVHVYEAEPSYLGIKPRYSVPVYPSAQIDELWDQLVLSRPKFGPDGAYLNQVAWARSLKRPEVLHNDIDWLVKELARLDARNVSRDVVFEGKALWCSALIVPLPDFFYRQLADRYPNARYSLALKTVSFA